MLKVIFLYFILSQFPPDTTYSPIYYPTPLLPPFNGSVYDPTTGTLITRISDYDSVQDWYPRHDYSKIQPWNSDMTLYKFYSVAIYDAFTHQKVREPEGIYYSLWSNTDPDIIYSFREDGVIQVYRVSADELDTIFRLEGYEIVKVGPGEGNIDRFDRFVALVCKRDTDLVVVVFNLQTHEIVSEKVFQGAWGNSDRPEYIDWVSVSQSGEYTGIMWDTRRTSPGNPFHGHFGVEIYRTSDLSYLRRIVEYGNHGDFCYDQNGDEVFVQFYGQGGTVHAYRLRDGHHTVLHTHPDFGYGDAHISCRNLNRPGWVYLSTDPERGGLIVALRIDGSGTVEYFGHHLSSAYNYTKSPMPVPSPDGRKVMFNSDFGDSLDPELVYVFEAEYQPVSVQEKEIKNVRENVVFDLLGRVISRGRSWRNKKPGLYFIRGENGVTKILIIK